jgi:lycopene beta-cyclase
MPYRGFYPGGGGRMLAGGYRGGWFHAATGYSFPLAIQFADWVSQVPIERLSEKISQQAAKQRWRACFARFLNRLLFVLVKPKSRYQIFRRFYRVLSEHRIARFYGHRFNPLDAVRIVVGVPPLGLQPICFAKSFFGSASQTPSSQVRQLDSRLPSESAATPPKSDSQLEVRS